MLTVSDKPSDAGPGYTTSPGHCLCPEPTVGGPTLPHLNWDPVRECTRFQSPTLPVGSALSDCSPFREEGGTMRLRQHPQEPEFSRGNVALAQEPSSALTPGSQKRLRCPLPACTVEQKRGPKHWDQDWAWGYSSSALLSASPPSKPQGKKWHSIVLQGSRLPSIISLFSVLQLLGYE